MRRLVKVSPVKEKIKVAQCCEKTLLTTIETALLPRLGQEADKLFEEEEAADIGSRLLQTQRNFQLN